MGRAPCCDKTKVKRGPWSPEEDNTLKNYVQRYGTGGNWIALPHKAGLERCGKSCRLRWLNYLRPDIKHGGFTEEEDNVILTLYTNIGSRWSVIASQLPGRTDNDVKNYWNTKLKKKVLAGRSTITGGGGGGLKLPTPPATTTTTSSNMFSNSNSSGQLEMADFSLTTTATTTSSPLLHWNQVHPNLHHQDSAYPPHLLVKPSSSTHWLNYYEASSPLPDLVQVAENGASPLMSQQETSGISPASWTPEKSYPSWPADHLNGFIHDEELGIFVELESYKSSSNYYQLHHG